MWPFKGKVVSPQNTQDSLAKKQIEEIQAWRGIGKTFDYLGRKCAITGYHDFIMCGWMPIMIPRLKANYADELGVIHSINLGYCEFLELRSREDA